MLEARTKQGTRTKWASLSAAVVLTAVMFAASDARAADGSIAVGEVSPPPTESGTDADVLRDVAAAEIKQLDVSRLLDRRKVVVSIALTKAVVEKTIACTVSAMLRDARTGVMIAIIEAGAQADGPASTELRKQVAHAALRSAMRRIPRALGGK